MVAETEVMATETYSDIPKSSEYWGKKTVMQVKQTIKFEFIRNRGKFLAMVITSLSLFALNLIIELISENQGALRTEDVIEYFTGYLGMLSLLILIIGTTFGGNMIAMDFEKHTGNLLFPKITKGRLMVGRVISRYVMAAASLFMYYLPTAIITYIYFGEIPGAVWESFGWAAYYQLMVLSFVIFFSSFMKRSSGASTLSLLILLIVFNLIQMLVTVAGVTAEPFFILTYFGNIITFSFNMPEVRSVIGPIGGHGPGGAAIGEDVTNWLTPSRTGAAIGMGIYTVVLLGAAYFIYRRRQNKQ